MPNLITVSEYRVYDDLPSPAENDSQIQQAIDSATNFIGNETGGRTFAVDPSPITATEILNGKGTCRLFTKNAPITSITSIEYWDGTQWVEFDSVTEPYSFKTNTNIVYFTQGQRFFGGYQNMRIVYIYGYDEIPEELKYACYVVAKQFVLEADRQGIVNQSDGEQTFTYAHNVPETVIDIIQRYTIGIHRIDKKSRRRRLG